MNDSADAIAELAPSGRLRAAINTGNSVIARKDASSGVLGGISVEIARSLAERTGCTLDLVEFTAAAAAFTAVSEGDCDVAFMAIEPARAREVSFSPPYLFIDGTYMVRQDSDLRSVIDADRPGLRISVGLGSAYDLYLTRTIRHATLVRAPHGGGTAMIEQFVDQRLDAVAGVRQPLVAYAARHPGFRVMDDSFMQIRQSVAVPAARLRAAALVRTLVEEMKASGFIAAWLRTNGQDDVTVAPLDTGT